MPNTLVFLLISGCATAGPHFSLLARSLKTGAIPGIPHIIGTVDAGGNLHAGTVVPYLRLGADNAKSGILPGVDSNWGLPRTVLRAESRCFCPSCCYVRVYWRFAPESAGGGWVIRILLLFKREPRTQTSGASSTVYSIKLGNRALPERILEAVWGFFSAALVFIVSILAIIATGVDDFSAFASVVATLNNTGPGLGVVADNFASMNPVLKWILIANMLTGRLEIIHFAGTFTDFLA